MTSDKRSARKSGKSKNGPEAEAQIVERAPETVVVVEEAETAAPAAPAAPETPVVETTVEEAPVPTEDKLLPSFEVDLESRIASLESVVKNLKFEISSLRNMKKRYIKEKRNFRKRKNKRESQHTSNGIAKRPSGFAQSSKISDALCEFLNIPHGTEIARTEVTKKIIAYIKDNSLEIPENKRIIKPDARLESIVGNDQERLELMRKQFEIKPPKEGTSMAREGPSGTLGYFNLQVHLNKHFIKKNVKNEQVVTAVSVPM